MLENLTWLQVLLPLSVGLAIYYLWVLSTCFAGGTVDWIDQGKVPSRKRKQGWSSRPWNFGGNDRIPLCQGDGGSTEFLDQLRLYLEPYRNGVLYRSAQGDVLGDLLAKYNPAGNSERGSILMKVLEEELHEFKVKIVEENDSGKT